MTLSSLVTCDGYLLKKLVGAGLAWLQTHQENVNRLNVFPVPDGDTGTNMFLTMHNAYEQIANLDDGHVGKVSHAIAQGALTGARGNSGVILSQWWRGFAEALETHPAFDAPLFAAACKRAVERAYKAVGKPVEGTILTVTRQAMEAVNERAQAESDLQALFETKVQAAYHALKHTPELLPILKDAGVVDSGGQGWTFIIEGMLRLLRGEDMTDTRAVISDSRLPSWQEALEPDDHEGYGYDVQFLMHGQGMDVEAIQKAIAEIGWSDLVVGDDRLIKVHVHVHDPGIPISYAIRQGAELDDVVVENMQRQYQTYVATRAAREQETLPAVEGIAVIAVAPGEGLRRLFSRDLGAARLISGGQTMNPSTDDFLKAIRALPNDELILMPNNPNILLAAQQAASLAENKQVRVVPTRSIPQGIAAMIEYGNGHGTLSLPELADTMSEAARQVITCELTTATRSVALNGLTVQEGQWIGLIDDQLSSAGSELYAVVHDMLGKAGASKNELITVYYGEQISEPEAQELVQSLSADFPDQEFQVVNGGQPLYPYIMSLE